jgi:hypothetical protein
MTVGVAAAAANGWLDGTFATATCFVKLHTGDPGASGATAAAAGSTTRVQATMAAASGGSKAMSSMASSWTNAGTTETLSHISLWTASTAGTFNGSVALTAPQAWASGNTFSLTSLSIAITPIAA